MRSLMEMSSVEKKKFKKEEILLFSVLNQDEKTRLGENYFSRTESVMVAPHKFNSANRYTK